MTDWRALYPFAGRRLDLGGYAMHYLDEGRGEAVLMLHGNPSWSFYFRELVKALRPTHRCLAPDHVGMGLSDRPDERHYRYTLASRVADLERLMARVAPAGPVTLVLHDWGGMIGMAWAVRHPRRVKAIVAFNTACFALPQGHALPGLLRLLRSDAFGWSIRASRWARRRVLRHCTVSPLPAQIESGYLEVCDGWDESLAVQRFVQDIPLRPGDPAWGLVAQTESRLGLFRDTPVLLPWGMRDRVFDAPFLEGWLRRFARARVRRFQDRGHFLLEDAPGELLPLIREFVGRPASA